MSESKTVVYTPGIGLSTALCLVFIILKLTGTIAWSWWWVTAPIWIPWLIVLVVIGAILLIGALAAIFSAR